MTMDAKRRRVHEKLAGLPGVRPIRRPVSPGSADEFDLYYVRSGRRSAHPLVIIPGGPGVASVQMYKGLRRRAVAAGLDVIMIEHRGVGLSRHDDSGADLPPQAFTVDQVVDDVAAVLDDAHVDSAIIYGTSYGSYVAAGLGVRYPGLVWAMILDSPLLSQHDIAIVRDGIRGLLLKGSSPETAALAPKVRKLVDAGCVWFHTRGVQQRGGEKTINGARIDKESSVDRLAACAQRLDAEIRCVRCAGSPAPRCGSLRAR